MIPGTRRPLILGHRGAPRQAPENTLRSFDLAVRAGADGVEFDVRPTRDGVPAVAHDDSLGRTFGDRRRISGLDWGAIQRLTGARIPSLDQVTAWAAAAGAWLNVEIKASGVEEAVVQRLRDTGQSTRAIVSSFDAAVVGRVGELDPELPCYLLTERWDSAARAGVERAKVGGVCLRVDDAVPENLRAIGDLGLPIVVWTVNEPDRVRALLAAGVAGIISDDPGMAAAVRDELFPR